MKRMLVINGLRLLLPSSANVNALLDTLGRAETLRWEYQNKTEFYVREGQAEIELHVLQDSLVIDPKKPKALAEKAGPDANNSDVY